MRVYFDEKTKKIGLKPVPQPTPNSYKVSKGRHSMSISFISFLKYSGIDFSKTRHFKPFKGGEFIVFDLKSEI